ncbi:MAG: serine protease [Rubrivivax sp.]|nr:serine protease [Rubrivivax sp.]
MRAVIGVQAEAVEDARSSRTLGAQREGSGIVIGADGLVLTIGYLILEAQSVWLVNDTGQRIPAQVVAYDLATGFGLVKALAPLGIDPVPLEGGTAEATPLLIASGGSDAAVTLARLVSRRAFSGFWEYHIEGALFTTPPRRDHSGAALFNAHGQLLGVGSLFVPDAGSGGGAPTPGNMFVPVELLRPILAELRQRGSSAASTRAWLGISCVERDGEVRVLRVNDDSPAEVAGLAPRDLILRIDDTPVTGLDVLWKTLWAGGQPERPVQLLIRRQGQTQTITVYTVDRAKTLKRPARI